MQMRNGKNVHHQLARPHPRLVRLIKAKEGKSSGEFPMSKTWKRGGTNIRDVPLRKMC